MIYLCNCVSELPEDAIKVIKLEKLMIELSAAAICFKLIIQI